MSSASLTSDIIDRPSLWRLYLEVTPGALEVVAYSTHNEQSLIHRSIPFDPAASSQQQALGDVIYDNELLLADFARTGVLIDTPRYMVVPASVTDQTATEMATAMWGDDITVLSDTLPLSDVRLITAADRATAAFLRRTFPTVTPHHPMSQLITYFYNKDRMNNASRMYVHVRESHIDIIHFDSRQLKIASSFETSDVDDMVYYTMLAAQNTGFDVRHDELMVCGIAAQRRKLPEKLRRYVSYVMPVVFPSVMYHAGKEALESPFELIVMPLCE